MLSRLIYLGLVGGTVAYRELLSMTLFESRNCFLDNQQLQQLKFTGSTEVETVPLRLFPYSESLDKAKKTVVVETDGSSGIILAHALSATEAFNVVCVSKESNMARTSSGSSPVYDSQVGCYNNGLSPAHWPVYGGRRWSFYLNQLLDGVGPLAQPSQVEDNIRRNAEILEGVLKAVALPPFTIPFEVVQADGRVSNKQMKAVNKRALLLKLTEMMIKKEKPVLLLNEVNVIRAIFADNDSRDRQFVGLWTDIGIILGDYYILSTEEYSKEKAKMFGLQLPIFQRPFFYSTASETAKDTNTIDLRNHSMTLSGKAMTSHPTGLAEEKVFETEVTADGHPIIGKVLWTANCYFNLGFGGNLLPLGFWAAEHLARELQNKESGGNVFAPSRFWFNY